MGKSILRKGIRAVLGTALLMLLFAMLLCPKGHGDYRILVASDLHYIAPSLTDGGEYYQRVLENGDSKFMPHCEEITSAFFEEVLAERPDALVLTGDLTFNGAVMSHEALAEKLRTIEAAGIPVLIVTGNHDVYNSNAARFHGSGFTRVPSATGEIFAEIYADFGPGEALSVAPDSLSYTVSLTESDRVLALDLNTAHDFCGISRETLSWVEEQLSQAKADGASVLAVGHQNLFQHTVFRGGYVIEGAEELAALFREYGVRLYLSGHLHIQHILEAEGVTEIASSALCSYPCQYSILEVTDGGIHYSTRRLDLKAWAERNGRSEEVFDDFQNAAAEYMMAHLVSEPPASVLTERREMTEYLQRLNLAYFSGDLRDLYTLDPDGHLADLWLSPGDLTSLYISSVLKDAGKDFTVWNG